jgi:thiol-disulfide isomerase/thioredoxin
MITTLVMLLAAGLGSEKAGMEFIASGTLDTAGHRLLVAEPDQHAKSVKKTPEGLSAPMYWTASIGDQSWLVVLDEPEDKPARLFVDTNRDGDLTNDPEVSWIAKRDQGSTTYYQGHAQIDLDGGNRGSLRLFRNAPNGPSRPSDPRWVHDKNRLVFSPDYGYEITIRLDGQEFTSIVCGEPNANLPLWIDRDGNQEKSTYEFISIGQPFNFTGTTYMLALEGGEFTLDKAESPLPRKPWPPDLSLGKQALSFVAEATDGAKVEFPQTYAGKLVMLDFWAMWCGPCIKELPHMKMAYETWHDRGFEILGISFDDKGMADEVAGFTKEQGVPWPQIYEGKRWETMLGELYDVRAIPFMLLIDGDSGEIVGTTKELLGPGLSNFVGKALSKKEKKSE